MPVADLERLDPYDSLYISPHGDDVALSCPARILSETRRGLKALVVGLFAGPGAEGRDSSDVPGALARLGADYVTAGFPAASGRYASDASFRSLAYHRRPEDEDWLDRATRLLNDLGPRTRALHVYAPLGVGGHIDHRLSHEAALRVFAGKPGRNVFFYEECPEAFVPGAVRVRLGVLGARLPPGAVHAARRAGLARYLLRFHIAPSMRGEFQGWGDRLRSTGPAARQWREARGWNPQRAFGPRFQPIVHAAEEEALPALRDVAAAAFPAGPRRARLAHRFTRLAAAYAQRLGASPHGERYWLLLPYPDDASAPATAVGQD